MTQVFNDFRFALRLLMRRPGFTITAVLTAALGIGMTTAMFSVANGVVLRPLPYPESERLVYLGVCDDDRTPFFATSKPDFIDWREGLDSLDQVGAVVPISMVVMRNEEATRIGSARMSADVLTLLHVTPFLGRPFIDEEYEVGRDSVALLSYGLWERWGADPNIVGQSISRTGGDDLVVVGVLPREFEVPAATRMEQQTDLWLPLPLGEAAYAASRTSRALRVFGRLAPGVTVEQAYREAEILGSALATEYPKAYMKSEEGHLTIGVASLRKQTVGRSGDAVLILLGATGFLLLIACANIANLLIAESAGREHEFAVRSALGAGRRRVIEQLLAESVLLGLIGGSLGVALAGVLVGAFRTIGSAEVPRLAEVVIDQRALWFAFAVSVLTGVLFGFAPALINSRVEPAAAIKEGGRNSSGGAGTSRLRRILIVAETALAVVLLSGAGLLAASFVNLQNVDPGFEPEGLKTVAIGVSDALPEPKTRIVYFNELLSEIESVPGVDRASMVSTLPLNGYTVWSPGVFRDPGDPEPIGGWDCLVTAPGYFETMGIRIESGRGFNSTDDESGMNVAVVSRTFARRLWPGADPLGRQFFVGSPDTPPVTVVGVVSDVHTIGLDAETAGAFYLAHSQVPSPPTMYVVVRSERGSRDLGDEIREIMARLNREIPFEGFVPLRTRVSGSVNRPKFNAFLLTMFAGTALLLAAVGVSATLLNSVTRRTREIGLRVALGATVPQVIRTVIRESLVMTGLGIAIGLAATVAMSRVLASFLFGITATDPVILAGACLSLAGVAAVACYLPARRAMRMDPVNALRTE